MDTSLIPPMLAGFFLGASLIIAIGAQNAFILRQGLLGQHVFVLCLICSLSDALLITVGVAGLGTLIAQSPVLITLVTVGGALFLYAYASKALRRAMRPDTLQAANEGKSDLKAAVLACLAFTFLNPHVYLDTVLLVGSLSSAYSGAGRWFYAAGASLASFVWFFRVLDTVIAVVMAALASGLLARLV